MTQLASLSTEESFSKSWKHPDILVYEEEPPPLEDIPRYLNMATLYPDWHAEARCNQESETVFFGQSEPDVRPQYTLSEIKRARSVCETCPVAKQCMTAALLNREEFGVWAGSTRSQRKTMLKRIASGESTIDKEVDRHITRYTIRTQVAS